MQSFLSLTCLQSVFISFEEAKCIWQHGCLLQLSFCRFWLHCLSSPSVLSCEGTLLRLSNGGFAACVTVAGLFVHFLKSLHFLKGCQMWSVEMVGTMWNFLALYLYGSLMLNDSNPKWKVTHAVVQLPPHIRLPLLSEGSSKFLSNPLLHFSDISSFVLFFFFFSLLTSQWLIDFVSLRLTDTITYVSFFSFSSDLIFIFFTS